MNEVNNNKSENNKICGEKKIIFSTQKTLKKKEVKKHDKFSSDNLIKKLKCYLLKFLVKFANLIIKNYKSNKIKEYTLIKINHIEAKDLDTKNNLALLDMPIKEILSKEKSKHFKNRKPSNKETIEKLLRDEINNIIIQTIFTKMTFREWLQNFKNKEIKEINKVKIEFKGVDKLLKEIDKENNIKYINMIKYHLDNFEEWFKKRKPRNKNKSQKKGLKTII